MKKYVYKAKNPVGETINGIVESPNEKAAIKILHEHDLLIITLSEKKELSLKSVSVGGPSVSEREVATFTRLLSTMLSTGLPLTDALSNLATQTNNKYFRELVKTILRDVQAGSSLSESLSRYPAVYNNLYINLVKSGEASGKVGESLGRLADTMESNLEFKAKIKGAMVYPAILVTAMIGVAVLMITFVVPKIGDVYRDFHAELPLPTRVLIAISDIMRNYTIFVVIFFGVLFFAYRVLRKNPTSDLLMNNFLFRVPVVGPMNAEANLALIFRTLGTLLASGVAIIDALDIVSHVVDNNYFRTGLEMASKSVEKGLPLSLAIRRNPDFPPMVAQLMAIGEETGTLDQSLDRLANFYQESAERKVKTLTTALEPMMLLLMGVMVGGLAIAVMLPMFNLINVIK